MEQRKIYISLVDAYYNADPAFLDYFRELGFEVAFRPESSKLSDDEVVGLFSGCDICVANAKPVTRRMMEAAPNLKLIAVFGAGFNQIDIEAADKRGIYVTNARGGNSRSVAEHTFAMFLDLSRALSRDDDAMRQGRWLTPMGRELQHKTLGIIGYGAIGREVAAIGGGGFSMQILAYDPFLQGDEIARTGARPATLDELLSESDYISIHTPLCEGTRGLIGARELALMKRDGVLVNVSRGGVVDEEALKRALDAGRIGGAGVDVHKIEPVSAENPSPFAGCPNTVLSSHSGASSVEAIQKIGALIKENVEDVMAGRRPRHNIVNGV